jgi:UDP-glucose 4-epimerase
MAMRRALVTGGAGFIGSSVADRLLGHGVEVVVYDSFATGRPEFVEGVLTHPGGEVIEADVLDAERLRAAMGGCDTVFHFAANADVRHGLEHPQRDLEQNTVATSEVLEAMRAKGVERIVFTSTGSVYGEPEVFPTPEHAPFPVQTSLYAASKLAGEGMIQAYCHGYGFTAAIFRLVSTLGERYTHGHVRDFYLALREHPDRLRVLGNGRQEKSYLYVQDLVSGMLQGLEAVEAGTSEVFNIGTDETVVVEDSVRIICEHMGVEPEIEHTGGTRGWPGDSPLILLDCAKLRSIGWRPEVTIPEAIGRTLTWFDDHIDVLVRAEEAR